MPFGQGKYDNLCSFVRAGTGAKVAVVVVMDGHAGSGFSLQAQQPITFRELSNLVDALRTVASQLESDITSMRDATPK